MANKPTLKKGAKGPAVKVAQTTLNDRGYDVGDPDGVFGPRTEKAVKAYQNDGMNETIYPSAVDGILGPKTWARLDGASASGGATIAEGPVLGSGGATVVEAPTRVGLLMLFASKVNEDALRFLVLSLNREQAQFEYEFLPFEDDDEFLVPFFGDTPLSRERVQANAGTFTERFCEYLRNANTRWQLKEEPPVHFVLLTTATLRDNYYSVRTGNLSLIALGNWRRVMAPPSLIEFILTLLVQESVGAIAPRLSGSVHLGTKGCLFDFTPVVRDAREKVLHGFICSHCKALLAQDGFKALPEQLEHVLDGKWLGTPGDPGSPAGIAFNLGYDLFVTKGLRATPWESFRGVLQQEGATQIVRAVGVVIVALLVVVLGLK
jgi:hypothetical protein